MFVAMYGIWLTLGWIAVISFLAIAFAFKANYWRVLYEAKVAAVVDAKLAADITAMGDGSTTGEVTGKLLSYGATSGPLTEFGNAWLCADDIYAVDLKPMDGDTQVYLLIGGDLKSVHIDDESGKCIEAWLVDRAKTEALPLLREKAEREALSSGIQAQSAHSGWEMGACMDEALREFDHSTDPALHGVGTAEAVGVEDTEFLKAARLCQDGTFYTSPQVMDLLAKSGAGPSQEATASIVFTAPGDVAHKTVDGIPTKKHEPKLKGAGKAEQSRKRNNV